MTDWSRVEKQVIAFRHVNGAGVAELARQYGVTTATMRRRLLTDPELRSCMADAAKECQMALAQAQAMREINAPELVKQLHRDATGDDKDVRRWALPLALERTFGPPPAAPVLHTHQHLHAHAIGGSTGQADQHPVVAAVIQASKTLVERDEEGDITTDSHVLEGEAARPRPEGIEKSRIEDGDPADNFTPPAVPRLPLATDNVYEDEPGW